MNNVLEAFNRCPIGGLVAVDLGGRSVTGSLVAAPSAGSVGVRVNGVVVSIPIASVRGVHRVRGSR